MWPRPLTPQIVAPRRTLRLGPLRLWPPCRTLRLWPAVGPSDSGPCQTFTLWPLSDPLAPVGPSWPLSAPQTVAPLSDPQTLAPQTLAPLSDPQALAPCRTLTFRPLSNLHTLVPCWPLRLWPPVGPSGPRRTLTLWPPSRTFTLWPPSDPQTLAPFGPSDSGPLLAPQTLAPCRTLMAPFRPLRL